MKRTKALALAAGMALLAAACGDSDADTTPTQQSEDNVATTVVPSTTEEMSDEEMDDEEMSDEEMGDEEMSDEEMGDEEMSDEEMGPVNFIITVENLTGEAGDVRRAAVFNTPDGADEPGPILPGDTYRSPFAAAPGEKLSFATMLVQSNDLIVATGPDGIDLYDADGVAISGDISDQLAVFDVGTEVDQIAGEGADQAPRQAGPNTGDVDPDDTVRDLTDRDAGDYLNVTIEGGDNGMFELVITNVSDSGSLATPFAPGVTVVHVNANPLFVPGSADLGEGLEALAEDGNPGELIESLTAQAGVPSPIAPVAAIVHQDDNPLFAVGTDTKADGLEGLAEDGGPDGLVASLGVAVGAVPQGETDPGPAAPGQSYQLEVSGSEGDKLSLAFMLVHSNDWFFALDGIDLYTDGEVLDGDISDLVNLYDAGTEADQPLGVGADQPARQVGPNTGEADADTTVRIIETNTGLVRITISHDMG